MVDVEGLFSGMGDLEISKGRGYLPPGGVFKVRVTRCVIQPSMKGGHLYVVEFEVLESNHPDVPAGAKRAWFNGMPGPFSIGKKNVKAFIAACLGVIPGDKEAMDGVFIEDGKDLTESYCIESVGSDQPMTGVVLGLETVNIELKSGDDFTRHDWYPNED